MDEVWKQVSTPAFWVGTVIVGLLINFASQWMYGRLAVLPERWRDWFEARSARRRKYMAQEVGVLLKHPELVPVVASEASHYRTLMLMLYLFAFAGFALLRAKLPPVPPGIGFATSESRTVLVYFLLLTLILSAALLAMSLAYTKRRILRLYYWEVTRVKWTAAQPPKKEA